MRFVLSLLFVAAITSFSTSEASEIRQVSSVSEVKKISCSKIGALPKEDITRIIGSGECNLTMHSILENIDNHFLRGNMKFTKTLTSLCEVKKVDHELRDAMWMISLRADSKTKEACRQMMVRNNGFPEV